MAGTGDLLSKHAPGMLPMYLGSESMFVNLENKTINWENLMNFLAVTIVLTIVLDHPFNKRVVF